ncbi:MAG: hypothetical protein IH898_08455 [Planctomycetes bacterium]|nr:hypothetical protein [Planctomycetota bacterium]
MNMLLPEMIFLLALTLSLIVIRVGTMALMLTGLSRESARFQAHSAFTGVGFTTQESESIVEHPVRRHLTMGLMMLGIRHHNGNYIGAPSGSSQICAGDTLVITAHYSGWKNSIAVAQAPKATRPTPPPTNSTTNTSARYGRRTRRHPAARICNAWSKTSTKCSALAARR